jgi:lysophospholipase L1-like esterase
MRSTSLVTAVSLFLGLAACGVEAPTAPAAASAAGAAGASAGGTTSGGSATATAGSAGATSAGAAGASGGTLAGSAGTSAGSGGANGGSGGSGGTAGAAGAAGAGGSAPYNPCPSNGDACRIMPLGDSITDGCCGENTLSQGASYRLELFRLSLTKSKKLTFVGSHSSGPNTVDNVAFPKKQEGHSGWTIADGGGRDGLQDEVAGWLKATPPDIVTLMIGTNDIGTNNDLPNAPQRLGVLLDTIVQSTPNALVVVAQIVPTQSDSDNAKVQAFNAGLPAIVQARAAAGEHVILVDMYGAYTKNADYKKAYLANGLHPSDAGYAVMGTVWWDAIGNLLPAK